MPGASYAVEYVKKTPFSHTKVADQLATLALENRFFNPRLDSGVFSRTVVQSITAPTTKLGGRRTGVTYSVGNIVNHQG